MKKDEREVIKLDEAHISSLDELKPGEKGVIVRIEAGIRTYRRLLDMGLNIGELVEVVDTYGGPLLIKIGDNRVIAVGRGISRKIYVKVLDK